MSSCTSPSPAEMGRHCPALARSFQEANSGVSPERRSQRRVPAQRCPAQAPVFNEHQENQGTNEIASPLLRRFSSLEANAALAVLRSWKQRGAWSCWDSITLSSSLVRRSKVGTKHLHVRGTWVSSDGIFGKAEERELRALRNPTFL